MTQIKFPDKDEELEVKNVRILNKVPKNPLSSKNINIKSKKQVVHSQITTYLEDSLNFLMQNNYVPKLPKEIKVQYLYSNLEEKLTVNFKKLFNRPLSVIYKYPACVKLF